LKLQTVYISEDGKQFSTANECADYEKSYSLITEITTFIDDLNGPITVYNPHKINLSDWIIQRLALRLHNKFHIANKDRKMLNE
jgi:hypothetical protein